MTFKAIIPTFLVLMSSLVVACTKEKEDEPKPEVPEQKDSVIFQTREASMLEGETFQIKSISSGEVTYSSSNPDIASVSSKGLVSALKKGKAAIYGKVAKEVDSCLIEVNGKFEIQHIDPLTNPMPEEELVDFDGPIEVARGESAVIQMMVKPREDVTDFKSEILEISNESGDKLFPEETGWVKGVQSSYKYQPGAFDQLKPSSGKYPDLIMPQDYKFDVTKSSRAAFITSIAIPENAKPGLYTGKVRFSATAANGTISTEEEFSIKVYPVTLEKQQLMVTNWYHPYLFNYMNMNQYVEEGSETYWTCMKALLQMASNHGQNVWLLPTPAYPIVEGGKITGYDFTDFDKLVEFILDNCVVERLEGNHCAFRTDSGWTSPFVARISVPDGANSSKTIDVDPSDPQFKEFAKLYFPTLQEHLRSKKLKDGRSWLDIFMQHVGDEPIASNLASWEAIAATVKEYAPELRIIDAYRSATLNSDLIDVAVPQLDEILNDCFTTASSKTELWFYTCMYPRGNYANRYVCLPLVKTRILHWINYKYGFTGYLHWALNYWGQNGNPAIDVSSAANDWPGGDAYIVYPGYHTVYPSIRLLAMRDGIRDYTLLKMVEKKNPAKAKEYVDLIVKGISSYNTKLPDFRKTRHEMLEYLAM